MKSINNQELYVRVSLGTDYLAKLYQRHPHGDFFLESLQTGKNSNWFNHMASTSLLFSSAELLKRDVFRKMAIDCINRAHRECYRHNDKAYFILHEDKSSLLSAWMGHCLVKQGKLASAMQFFRGIDANIVKGSNCGVILIALLEAYEYSHQINFLNDARKIGQLIISFKQISGFDAWALAMLNRYDKKKEHSDFPKHVVEKFNIKIENMFGLSVPISLQACLAWKDTGTQPEWVDRRISDLIDLQCSLQINPGEDFGLELPKYMGAFVREQKHPNDNISYQIHTLLAFMQHLQKKTLSNVV